MTRLPNLICEPQAATRWCWAAVTQALMRAFGRPDMSQFQIAERVIPVVRHTTIDSCRADDNPDGAADICNLDVNFEQCLTLNGFEPNAEPFGLGTAQRIIDTIRDRQQPVCLRLTFPLTTNNVGHVIIACGFTDDNKLIIQDPINQNGADKLLTPSLPLADLDGAPCTVTHAYFVEFADALALAANDVIPWTNWWKTGRQKITLKAFAPATETIDSQPKANWQLIVENGRILYIDQWSLPVHGKRTRIGRITNTLFLNSLEASLNLLAEQQIFPNSPQTELRIWDSNVPFQRSLWVYKKKSSYKESHFMPLYPSTQKNKTKLVTFDKL